MLLRHSATVNGDVDSVFQALADVRVVAECLPGAKLKTVEGDEFCGTFPVRLGPLRLSFSGNGRLSDTDAEARQVTIRARGRDQDQDSDLDLRLVARCLDDDGTQLCFSADIDIRGKAAVLGKGFVVDQFSQIVDDFAAGLGDHLLQIGSSVPAATRAPDSPASLPVEPLHSPEAKNRGPQIAWSAAAAFAGLGMVMWSIFGKKR